MKHDPRDRPVPVIRGMRDADIGRCFEIRMQTRENSVSRAELEIANITERSVGAKLATTHRGWVCEEDGAVVGFSIADGSNGELWVVAVLPGHEGRGIGTRLVESAQRWLHGLGWAQVWLWTSADTSTRAYQLYCRLGWQDCGVQDGRLTMRHRQTSEVTRAGSPAAALDRGRE